MTCFDMTRMSVLKHMLKVITEKKVMQVKVAVRNEWHRINMGAFFFAMFDGRHKWMFYVFNSACIFILFIQRKKKDFIELLLL